MTAASWIVAIALFGAEPAELDESAVVDRLSARFADQATFLIGPTSERKLVWRAKPLLKWSNPTAGRVHGQDFVVVEKGIPRAYVSVYQWFDPYKDATIELTSLAEEPVRLERDGKVAWNTKKSTFAFRDIADAPAPAANPSGRLTQMKRLAARASASLTDTRGNKSGVERQLRLLGQPLYRYESEDPATLDGAVFAFVEATDPEALLILEARKGDKPAQWRYGFARRNSDALVGKFDGERVWSVEFREIPWDDPTHEYHCPTVNDLREAELAESP